MVVFIPASGSLDKSVKTYNYLEKHVFYKKLPVHVVFMLIFLFLGMFIAGDYQYSFINFLGVNISVVGSLIYTKGTACLICCVPIFVLIGERKFDTLKSYCKNHMDLHIFVVFWFGILEMRFPFRLFGKYGSGSYPIRSI